MKWLLPSREEMSELGGGRPRCVVCSHLFDQVLHFGEKLGDSEGFGNHIVLHRLASEGGHPRDGAKGTWSLQTYHSRMKGCLNLLLPRISRHSNYGNMTP